jgi:hypothetical protein
MRTIWRIWIQPRGWWETFASYLIAGLLAGTVGLVAFYAVLWWRTS